MWSIPAHFQGFFVARNHDRVDIVKRSIRIPVPLNSFSRINSVYPCLRVWRGRRVFGTFAVVNLEYEPSSFLFARNIWKSPVCTISLPASL